MLQNFLRPIVIATYSLGIRAYGLGIWVASFWNRKAGMWIAGRRVVSEERRVKSEEYWIWVHCASVGEFEQGRPLLERIRAERPGCKILLTFFSPSGFELRKKTPLADAVHYMPLDTRRNALEFIEKHQPQMAIFVKYEFWYHHLAVLHSKKIPFYLVSARFRTGQHFFGPFGGLFREMLGYFEHVFVQDEASKLLLNGIGIQRVSVCGDTRADRVAALARHPSPIPIIERFAKGAKVMVCGSTWPADEAILLPFIQKELLPGGWKLILAPHEMHEAALVSIQNSIGPACIRYTQCLENEFAVAQVLLLDTIGMLAEAYQYGRVAYIGGGFGKGIHNVLEPAAHGLPVLFGPKYQKFREATDLIEMGGAISIKDLTSLNEAWLKWSNDDALRKASQVAKGYVAAQEGATDLIFQTIFRASS